MFTILNLILLTFELRKPHKSLCSSNVTDTKAFLRALMFFRCIFFPDIEAKVNKNVSFVQIRSYKIADCINMSSDKYPLRSKAEGDIRKTH